MKLGKLQKKWLNALKSGDYKQCRYELINEGEYCCLGVACETMGLKHTAGFYGFEDKFENSTLMPGDSWQKLKLRSDSGALYFSTDDQVELFHKILSKYKIFPGFPGGRNLTCINDQSRDYNAVIEVIEKMPQAVFTGSV